MERVFEYKNGEIKVIWNELLIENNYKKEWIQKEIRKTTKSFCDSFSVGLELKVHKGGRMCYGMLMACVKPNDEQDCIKVSIAFSQRNSIKYSKSLLSNDEYVYEGLPKEYVESVCSSVYRVIDEKDDYPQCDIAFAYAANCEVGSSPMIFSIITKMLLELIYCNAFDEISSMSIENFTQKYVRDITFRYR